MSSFTPLAAALQYAGRGWKVFPCFEMTGNACACGRPCQSPGKHPRIKGGCRNASTDQALITSWWTRWPNANVAIATGDGRFVVDLDSEEAAKKLQGRNWPATLVARTGRGWHLHYTTTQDVHNSAGSGDEHGIDVRGEGGYVLAPPSNHMVGRDYAWENDLAPAAATPELEQWALARSGGGGARARRGGGAGAAPATVGARLDAALREAPAAAADIAAALAVIPNDDRGWDDWNRILMAVWRSCNGHEIGIALADTWSRKSAKWSPGAVDERWLAFSRSPPTALTFGTLVHEARQAAPGWEPPTRVRLAGNGKNSGSAENGLDVNGMPAGAAVLTPTGQSNPLAELNKHYAVIGNIGNRCLVLSFVSSVIDPGVMVPSLQTFKTFSDRFSNQFLQIASRTPAGKPVEHHRPLGQAWLTWPQRRTFAGLDLAPGAPEVLAGGALNLWRGWGVEPKAGSWDRMQGHIERILGGATPLGASYIAKWAAWAVQHPGEPAGAALVFRGGRGTGKGTFGHAMRRIFGAHGWHIYNSKHLVGHFNAHMRNTILLFADEAFWAGDKQGLSTLQALITEPLLVVEQKGVDAVQWKNRLHLIMAANAEWVVPAAHDERRYAVFDVAPTAVGDKKYFAELYAEMENGGLAAMLWDMLHAKLGDWHPREIPQTRALQEQKQRSLDPRWEFWEGILQNGIPEGLLVNGETTSAALLALARDQVPALKNCSVYGFARMLAEAGCKQRKTTDRRLWTLPTVAEGRQLWERRFGVWPWNSTA
jgi:hypothetical protein